MEVKDNVITWDYDGTLDHHFGGQENNPYIKQTRDYVKRLIRKGYNVYIITRRYGPENSSLGFMDEHLQVWKTAAELGIRRENVIFTNRMWKYSFIESVGACMHIDDDEREKYWIERHLPKVKAIWLGYDNWEEQLINVVDGHDKLAIFFGNKRIVSALLLIITALCLAVYLLR